MLPRALSAALATGLVATLLGALPSAPAYAANPVTPGNFTGYGFDQCDAPSQSAMSTWIKKSPFRAAGIYISGNSRACRTQANLTPTWVKNQLAAGWHLMPITLGPQAACSTRYPRYGKNIDPTIIPTAANTYYAARSQGRAEARKAVTTAQRLGIVRGSTLFYDLEAFDIRRSTTCTNSALWYLTAWTRQLHDLGYASGYYSSAASGIRMMDDQRVAPNSALTMPDQVWIADWNGKANTSSSYIRSDGWLPYGRMKQYQGGHNETYGGVRINIDRNYLNLRTPKIPGSSAPAPKPTPAPAAPKYTGNSTSDARCTPATITRRDYPTINAGASATFTVPLQCLLKQQHLYKYQVTGQWNSQTQAALGAFQTSVGLPRSTTTTRQAWTALVTHGNSHTLLHLGVRNADAVRVQRAMNAALARKLAVSGTYRRATKRAVKAYQRAVGLPVTGTVTAATWAALERGRT
jgi:peptidoglycan hydrolase-like protein with peptidoglycan-binding domain